MRLFSGGQILTRRVQFLANQEGKKLPNQKNCQTKRIAKPVRLILFLYIIRGIKIKRIEETNREISKWYERFTKIYIYFKHENMVNFTHNSGNKYLNYLEIKSKDLVYPKKFLKKKNEVWELISPDFQSYFKVIVLWTVGTDLRIVK